MWSERKLIVGKCILLSRATATLSCRVSMEIAPLIVVRLESIVVTAFLINPTFRARIVVIIGSRI
jgi:hypothetical protein